MPKEQKPKITDERDILIEKLKDKVYAVGYLVASAAQPDDRVFQTAVMDVAEAWHVEKNELAGRYVRKRLDVPFDARVDAAERLLIRGSSPAGREKSLPEVQDTPTATDSGTTTGRYTSGFVEENKE